MPRRTADTFRGAHSTVGYAQGRYIRRPVRVGRIKADGYRGSQSMSMDIENTPAVRSYILELLAAAEEASETFLRIELTKTKGSTAYLVLALADERTWDD